MMIAILCYNILDFKLVTVDGYVFPNYIYAIGWGISALGLIQLPLFAIAAVVKQKGNSFYEVSLTK